MDKKDLRNHQINNMPLDALNTPSKDQEQMQESDQRLANGNENRLIKRQNNKL
ncbi:MULTISPECIES: hypothetical protein [Bacillus]|uniref:hypothetical protein n=1 Tax=Bacillus TaxID=1386 RepID=UPI00032FFD32|nr:MULTISPECIES: hypothetical protein [Bacillus cereus group]EOP52549.1 hypothetical protein IIW_02167 [Bacillus cereus VD136]EOP68628.1 hypothetical protein KOW_03837 [Bacillus cereus VDM006]EOQ05277.1 hypothetical protein KOY_03063 [Bacillus cereus VDM021]OOG91987.1 hypothetical protein BTH41_01095 [Bacillus mycoides]MDF2086468.1 hypothetical protein [Bacillus pseudomycoides]